MRRSSVSFLDGLPKWTLPYEFGDPDEGGARDPLRAQMVLDRVADGLFRSADLDGPGLTSLTDHLGYLAFHGWARRFIADEGLDERTAYKRLVWIHAFVNKSLVKRNDRRWTVYGIRRIQHLSKPEFPKWEQGPPKLVAIDPWARYDGLWTSIPDGIRDRTTRRWPGLNSAQFRLLKRWALGDRSRLTDIETAGWGKLRLTHVSGLQDLATHLAEVRLGTAGTIGNGLPGTRLGAVLGAVKREPAVESWTVGQINDAAYDSPVKERMRRAALGRAVVLAANWEFYRWARPQVHMEALRPHGDFKSPSETLNRIARILQRDASCADAFRAIDNSVRQAGGCFTLHDALRNADRLTEWVVSIAANSGKGFVVPGHNQLASERKYLVEGFKGSYAGGLRLRQAWRFGRDIDAAKA